MRSINRAAGRARLRFLLLGFFLSGLSQAAAAQDGLVIRRLSFQGNSAIDDLTLANSIETTNSDAFATLPLLRELGLGNKRTLRARALETDVERLRVLYRFSGYLEVGVDTIIRRTTEDAYVTFVISEGRPVRLALFGIRGLDSISRGEDAIENLPLREGDVFNRRLLQASADTIANRLRDRGYPLVQLRLDSLRVDSAAYQGRVWLVVEPGPLLTIGPITVEGAEQPGDSSFVRDFLTTQPGRVYRQSDLLRSQRNLALSELYRFVSVDIDSAGFSRDSSTVPLLVRVNPGPRQRISTSVGYGTYDCFRGSIGWTGRNALGRGRILDLSARFSKLGVGGPTDWGLEDSPLCGRLDEDPIGSETLNYGVSASVRRPGFLSPSNNLTLSLFAELGSEFGVYSREEFGVSVQLTRETASRIPVTFGYRLAFGSTSADDADFCAYFNACNSDDIAVLRDRQRRGTLSVGLSSLRVNNVLDPTRGTSVGLQVAYSGALTGSEELQRFTRVTGDAAVYRPLNRDLVLAARIRAGMLFAPTVELAGQGGSAPYAPPDQRFYAGGPNDVRGFDGNQLGPVVYVFFEEVTDPDLSELPTEGVTVSPLGGNRVLVGNLELRLPSPLFPTRTHLAAFVDVGSVWEDTPDGAAEPIRIRATPGVGLRVATPLGPARLDLAYNGYGLPPGDFFRFSSDGELIQVVPGYELPKSKGITVHFAIGQAF